ncbi:MAG: hypothetical protein HYX87_03545 [Chloroflexi bacterium]|nr:hypothetical protein [Chloroflexota bacterium]
MKLLERVPRLDSGGRMRARDMRRFLDHHEILRLPPDAVRGLMEDIEAGRLDQHGTRTINVFIGNGQMWCLMEAADAESVCHHHESLGLKLGRDNVTEIVSLA